MTTTETASPRTSDLVFLDARGERRTRVPEWEPGYFEIDVPPEQVDRASVTINGRPAEVALRRLGGRFRVVAMWDRAGPGWYDIVIADGDAIRSHQVQVRPAKITDEAFAHLLQDLELRLPVTIAVALRDAGARIAVPTSGIAEQTLASEVARLRRAVYGTPTRRGLIATLAAMAPDPHRMLQPVGEWVRRDRVRRPSATGLVQALWRAGNVKEGLPEYVVDSRVRTTVDLYENRVVRSFLDDVERHALGLRGVLAESTVEDLASEVAEIIEGLRRARRSTAFLTEVRPLQEPLSRVSMVLLKRHDYRSAFEGYLDFRRRMTVQLDNPAMAEPLRNLPFLYQLWGTLLVIEAVLERASAAGYTVHQQRLVWPQAGGLYLRVLKDGAAALDMRRHTGERIRVIPERSYGASGRPLKSMSFSQRPDIAIEMTRPDQSHEVFLLDPKYKLVSEETGDGDGTPKKVDIDKMHAYRDAIRDSEGERVVRFAGTLYPGGDADYGPGLAALRMYPGEEGRLLEKLKKRIGDFLGA